jgi:transcriptional regulator with XRE-family HTH domain
MQVETTMPRRLTGPEHPSAGQRFGQRLRHWRTTAGLTQAELGRALTYDHSYVSKVESGTRWPPRELAERCDELLAADGELRRLWAHGDDERRRREQRQATMAALTALLDDPPAAPGGCPCGRGSRQEGAPVDASSARKVPF